MTTAESGYQRVAMACMLAGAIVATPTVARGQSIDLTGQWAARVHEDAVYRGAGGLLGDYTGLPINAAARQMAESWDADVLSQPERMTQAWPAVYSMRGEGPNLRISEVRDPGSEQLICSSTPRSRRSRSRVSPSAVFSGTRGRWRKSDTAGSGARCRPRCSAASSRPTGCCMRT